MNKDKVIDLIKSNKNYTKETKTRKCGSKSIINLTENLTIKF